MDNLPTPERTYVENPDAFLDQFTIEDHVRDVDYVVSKVKQFLLGLYRNAPGLVTVPVITTNPYDTSKLTITEFIGLDSAFNLMHFNADGAYGLDSFEPGTVYYIIARVSLASTSDTRPNPRQKNKKYRYLLRESIEIGFVTDLPTTDLCLGSYVVILDPDLGQYIAKYSTVGRSTSLTSGVDVFNILNDLKAFLPLNYVRKKAYSSEATEEANGDVVILTEADTFSMPDKVLTVGLNPEGKIGSQLIPAPKVLLNSSVQIGLPGGGIQTDLPAIEPSRLVIIYSGSEGLHAQIMFDASGNTVKISSTSNIFTEETPGNISDPDTLYLQSVLTDGSIILSIKNNYSASKLVRYMVL
jgi:hypothetical protein